MRVYQSKCSVSELQQKSNGNICLFLLEVCSWGDLRWLSHCVDSVFPLHASIVQIRPRCVRVRVGLRLNDICHSTGAHSPYVPVWAATLSCKVICLCCCLVNGSWLCLWNSSLHIAKGARWGLAAVFSPSSLDISVLAELVCRLS